MKDITLYYILFNKMTLRVENEEIIFRFANDIFTTRLKTSDIIGCKIQHGRKYKYLVIYCSNGNEYRLYPDNPQTLIRKIFDKEKCKLIEERENIQYH